jgi:hypothetical protein
VGRRIKHILKEIRKLLFDEGNAIIKAGLVLIEGFSFGSMNTQAHKIGGDWGTSSGTWSGLIKSFTWSCLPRKFSDLEQRENGKFVTVDIDSEEVFVDSTQKVPYKRQRHRALLGPSILSESVLPESSESATQGGNVATGFNNERERCIDPILNSIVPARVGRPAQAV